MKFSSDAPNLDILRTFAVLAVLVSHFWRTCLPTVMPSAFHNLGVGGVCFFFVHTSLVLFGSLERMKGEHRTRDFYLRRAFRIYPLCWITTAIVLCTGLTDIGSALFHGLRWRDYLSNVLLVQNLTHSPSVLGPLWSLPWEVQMYLILPLLFAWLGRNGAPVRLACGMWVVLTLVALLCTAFPVPSVLHAAVYPPMFLGGILAYHLTHCTTPSLPAWMWVCFVPALLVLRGLLLHGDDLLDPWNAGVNASICLLLGWAIPHFQNSESHWFKRAVYTIAKYSYGIYLFHMIVLMLLLRVLAKAPLALQFGFFALGTFALSVAGFHLVEEPFIRLGKRQTREALSANIAM